jgi:hypothetical protein
VRAPCLTIWLLLRLALLRVLDKPDPESKKPDEPCARDENRAHCANGVPKDRLVGLISYGPSAATGGPNSFRTPSNPLRPTRRPRRRGCYIETECGGNRPAPASHVDAGVDVSPAG